MALETLDNVLPLVGTSIGFVGIALDVQGIVGNATPIGVVKVVSGRIYNEYTPPALWIGNKCIFLVGGVISAVSMGNTSLVLGGTFSAFCSMIKEGLK